MDSSIFDLLSYPLSADTLIRKKRGLKRKLLEQDIPWLDKKIAILGGSTTNDIQDFLELFLLKEGIRPTFYASEFNQYWEDAMFGNAELKAFEPDIIYVHTTSRNITQYPSVHMSLEDINQCLDAQYTHFETMWDRLQQTYHCPIIQNNFERPIYRLMGNQDIVDVHGWSNFIYRLNGRLYEYAANHDNFFVHDIDYLAGQFGQAQWQSMEYWVQYKYALHVKAIPEFARSLSNLIKSIYGKNKKVVALDLDNTLWGGVVGDDGVENLAIGTETPLAESFAVFQQYLKEVKQLGILLTVDSKNDYNNAIAGLEHPNSILHPDDFAHIEANWINKDENLKTTAQLLNLGLDSFVFLDDNPAERAIVKAQVPMVTVLEAQTPEQFLDQLDHGGFFEITKLTKDDLARNEMYKANADRIKLQQSFESYDDYLRSLEMTATIRDFEPVYLQRIAQLTNKSNQFNLTTKRYSEADMIQMAESSDYIRLYGRLEDKFGDNGIVSVLAGRINEHQLHMELWLMSCRVLKRDMELAMFDRLVEECQNRGIDEIIGYYYPTPKNKMVKDFYQTLGFTLISTDDDGNTVWKYDTKKHEIKNKVILNILK